MASYPPPSKPSQIFIPSYYEVPTDSFASVNEAIQENKRQKLDKFYDTSVGQTIVNAVIQNSTLDETVQIAAIAGLQSQIDEQDLTSVVKVNELKQYIDVWNSNTVCYLDFSDPNNIGQDVTNHGRNAKVRGAVVHVTDGTRTHAIKFPRQTTSRVINRTAPCLTLGESASAFQNPNWSASMWVMLDAGTAGSNQNFTLLSSSRSFGSLVGSFLLVQSGNLILKTYNPGSAVTSITVPFTVEVGVWAHVVITSTPSQVFVYVNGVQVIASTDPLSCIDPYAYQLDIFVIGAVRETTIPPIAPNRHFDSWAGLMSDVSFYSFALSQEDVARLIVDDYGYAVYTLAGQSNMIGRCLAVPGIDDDYSKLESRVWQYNTLANVYQGTGTSVVPATNPLFHPQAGGATAAGLWRTFAINLLEYGNIAWRRKIMLVPCGWGGTGFASADHKWLNGGEMSNITIAATTNALGLNPLNSLAAFLWNQGESDISSKNMNYRQNMQDMLTLFAASIPGFSATSTPVILGEISQVAYESTINTSVTPSVSMMSQIRADMDALCAANPTNYRLVLTSDLQPMLTDVPHWDIYSIRTIGSRYFDAFSNIKGGFDRNVAVSIKSLNLVNPTFQGPVSGITKTMVGLGNVDNTSDASKPTSTATETALALKAPLINPEFPDRILMTGSVIHRSINTTNYSTYGHANIFSGNETNKGKYDGALTHYNFKTYNATSTAFAWVKQTSATTESVLATCTHGGAWNFPGTLASPTLDAINTSIADKATAASVAALSSTVATNTTNISNLQASTNNELTGSAMYTASVNLDTIPKYISVRPTADMTIVLPAPSTSCVFFTISHRGVQPGFNMNNCVITCSVADRFQSQTSLFDLNSISLSPYETVEIHTVDNHYYCQKSSNRRPGEIGAYQQTVFRDGGIIVSDRTWTPVFCSRKYVTNEDRDTGNLVMPGYVLIIYNTNQYNGTSLEMNCRYATSPQFFNNGTNSCNSFRLFYHDTEILIDGLS